MSIRALNLSARAAEPVRRGHPWVYREQILDGNGLVDGEDVRLVLRGATVGRGLASASGPIAVRAWRHHDAPVGAELFRERLTSAVALRTRLFDESTDAFRVVHGEGDRMPGLVVDRYGATCVVVLDDAALRAHVSTLVPAIADATRALGVRSVLLRSGRGADKRVELAAGEPPDMRPCVRERGVPFFVDLDKGQKTGAFLDQRDNRARVGALARGRSVLNLFSYAGGFSLHAALGGATKVTSVDVAAQGHATAQESFKRAGVSPSPHEFVTQDCFAFLEQAHKREQKWDLVVSDPPSFAPNEKSVPNALASYRSLHRACAAVLAPGGIFCAASCSSHVAAEAFASTLDDASLETDALRMVALHGAPEDHPMLAAFPEGRYLKFAILE
jgi:23S rRNA (cytosine1962-C5)-methyltransferase